MEQGSTGSGNQDVSVRHGVGAVHDHVEGEFCGQFLLGDARLDLRQQHLQRPAGYFAGLPLIGDFFRILHDAHVGNHAVGRDLLRFHEFIKIQEELVGEVIGFESHVFAVFLLQKILDTVGHHFPRQPPDHDFIVRALQCRILCVTQIGDEEFLSVLREQKPLSAVAGGETADVADVRRAGYEECVQLVLLHVCQDFRFICLHGDASCCISTKKYRVVRSICPAFSLWKAGRIVRSPPDAEQGLNRSLTQRL